jgi:putative phage-type endonuclease
MIIEMEQQTAEWLEMRKGRVTASRVADVMAVLKKGGESAARRNYRNELITEMLTGRSAETYVSEAMMFGTEQEPYARAAYEMHADVMVDPGGFAVHDTIDRFAASPDGRIGDDGLLEIKCPTTMNHVSYLLAGVVPEEYQPQMLAQMACTGRKWCDFVSFDPRLPKHLQLFVRRFERDDERIAEMEQMVKLFLADVDEILSLLKEFKS